MKWEHRTELFEPWIGFLTESGWEGTLDAQKLTDRLDALAEEDWELVSASEANMRRHVLLILRRPVPSE